MAGQGSARPRVVPAARALLVVAACASFAGAGFLLWRADRAQGTRLPGETLRAQPADGASFRQLADAAAARGDRPGAQRLYAIAVRRNVRDVSSRLRLVDAALARHDAAAALRHLDAALRVAPDAAEPALRRVLGMLADPEVRAALVARLASHPAWRDRLPGLLEHIDPGAAQALLSDLSAHPLPPAELALQVSLLESLGRARDARAAWHAALPASTRALDGLVFDGGFESGEGPAPYGWRMPSTPEALVGLETAHVAQGRSALSVLVQGRAVTLGDVSQRLVLAPGAYVLALQADSSLAGSGRGFAWVLTCNAPARELAHLAMPTQTRGWRHFTIGFAVPADCATQTLQLVHEGRNLAERSVSGRLGVDALQILPGPG